MGTVSGGQFVWGTFLPKSNGGVYQGRLSADGNRAGPVKGHAGLTARRVCRAGAKAELSEPMAMVIIHAWAVKGPGVGICHLLEQGQRLTDKSYPGDNRLVPPKRP